MNPNIVWFTQLYVINVNTKLHILQVVSLWGDLINPQGSCGARALWRTNELQRDIHSCQIDIEYMSNDPNEG